MGGVAGRQRENEEKKKEEKGIWWHQGVWERKQEQRKEFSQKEGERGEKDEVER